MLLPKPVILREETAMRRRKIIEDVKLVAGSNNFSQKKS